LPSQGHGVPPGQAPGAQVIAGAGVTETLRAALEAFNRAAWYRRMLELAGKVAIELDLDALREDRKFD